ncbi:hypothetical protein B0T12DRAFT_400182 [Alternaria alternata]|nr:hypothetical protein B0T12DRAFT_400182 [Alternaria alternata]
MELETLGSSPSGRVASRTVTPPSLDSSASSLVTTPMQNKSTPSTYSSSSEDESQRRILGGSDCTSESRDGFPSFIQKCCKALGLSAAFNLLAKPCGWQVTEREKVVMKQDQFKAALRCVVHLIPVSAALALLILNCSNHYIGGELSGTPGQDTQKLAALQFAAKLHELFMLASLGAIALTYIRKELVFGGGIPFGTVFSATQFKDLTFLWSPELWGTIYHKWTERRKKWTIVSLLVSCSIAGLTVGPSTSILMRPRLDEWPAGGTTFWINSTVSTLNPTLIEESTALSHCKVDNADQACPASGWRVVNEEYLPYWRSLTGMGALPQVFSLPGRSSLRQFRVRTRNVREASSSLLWGNAFTLATVSPSAVADALVDLERLWINAAVNADIGNFRFRRDASFMTEALQPVVLVRCFATEYKPNDSVSLQFPVLGNITLSGGPGSASRLGSFAVVQNWLRLNDTNATSEIQDVLATSDRPSVHWIDDIELLTATQSSLLAVATIPQSNAGPGAYHACSIDSRYANVTMKASRSVITHVSSEPIGYDNVGTFNTTYKPIRLSAKWAAYLNPVIGDLDAKNATDATVFSTLSSTAGLWTTNPATEPVWYPIIVENILATLISNGIGRVNFGKTLVGTLVGLDKPSNPWSLGKWVHEILPKDGKLGYGGHAFNISKADADNATRFLLKVNILGYAYSPEGATQVAAMVALSLYILLVTCHISYSVITGYYSSSWGSPSELTALAMNSDHTSRLRNTGGGIETIDVFKEPVWVRLKDGRAQMVFKDTCIATTELKLGKAYA